MKKYALLLSTCILAPTVSGQSLNGKQLLDKAIAYHDPQNQWPSFNGTLKVTMETPKKSKRESEITINIPEEYFYVNSLTDSISTEYILDKDTCTIKFNGTSDFKEEVAKANGLSCERATMYKNYYTYLYGLPMKLKDPGTHIHDKVELKTFKGKKYLVLKATYDEAVGSDIWKFYFDPVTYAMEVYQFYKSDPNGTMKQDSGEYILLTDLETVNGIKMPKKRAWYYNKDDKYLGTDFLKH